jgi:hypothetical protein
MTQKILTTLFTIFMMSSCNFESGSEDSSGGGLFSNHQEVKNLFLLIPPVDKTYTASENIDFVLIHSNTLTVTSSPRVEIDLGGSTVYADYLAGSGSKNLTFRYTVQPGDDDVDGVDIASVIDLNGGGIEFTNAGVITNANLEYTTISTSNVKIDTTAPAIVLVTPPTPKTYLLNQQLEFVVLLDDIVEVTGTPQIAIDIGGVTAFADYQSGSNSTTLLFRYSISGSDIDADGISISSPLTLNGGTIADSNGNSSTLTFIPIPMPTTYVNGNLPFVTQIITPTNKTYLSGEFVSLSLKFSEIINITGTPRIQINIGVDTKYVEYNSGSGTDTIEFDYFVVPGDDDNNGISIGNLIDLNGGTIQNAGASNASLDLSTPLTPGVIIDAGIPKVASIVAPLNNTYVNSNEMFFTLNYDKIVDITGVPRLQILINSTDPLFIYADYISGTGTQSIIFRYVVQANDLDLDGIIIQNTMDLNSGTIVAGNGMNSNLDITTAVGLITTTSILIDAAPPEVTAVTNPIDNNYTTGVDIDLTVAFSKNVDVINTPRLELDIGGVTRYADYLTGTGTSALTFRYSVVAPDLDSDGLSISNTSIDLNTTGTIQDIYGSNAGLDLTSFITAMPLVFVNYNPLNVTSITPPADATYLETTNIDFIVNTSEIVNIVGVPRVQLDIGGVTKYADYVSGTGTSALTFRYVVETSLLDLDGIVAISPLDLNAGTIKNASLQDLDLLITPPVMVGVLVDSTPSQITSITPPADGSYDITQNLDFIVNTDEIVNVTGIPRLQIDIGGVTKYADYISGTGTTALNFRYTVEASLIDIDGIALISPLDLNTGTIQNSLLQNLDLVFTPPVMAAVLVDSMPPMITSITPPADATYDITQNLDFIANTDELVNVVGTPRLQIDIGGVTKYADYLSGTGTTALTFRYVVEGSLYDNDGVTLTSPLDLNAGTIQSAALENMDLIFTPPVMAAVLVDSNPPTITSITPPADATYDISQNLDFIVIVDELVNVVGTPRLQIDIGGVTKYADYLSGTGSMALTFRYVVEGSLYDNDGIALVSPLDLNAGTIQSAALENMDLVFTPPVIAAVLVDSNPPTITSVTPPADATYIETNDLDFIVNTDELVNVSGNPRIQIDIGGVTKYADYFSGTGSTALTFRYTVEVGLTDTDGITLTSPLELNSGTIQSAALENLDLTFTLPTTGSVLVDSQGSVITSITPPADATYIETNNMDLVANIDEIVNVVGAPRIQLDIGGVTKYADYLSGTGTTALTFRYVVEVALSDLDGITLVQPLDLNSGTIKNAALEDMELTFSPPLTTSVFVDSLAPTVAITTPVDSSYINIANDSATFTVAGTCDESGQIVSIEVDAVAAASPVGFACNGATFSGTIDTTALIAGAHTIDAKLSDPAANEGVSTTINIIKDVTSPTISSVGPPVNNFYIVGADLDFIVNLDENTNVTGTPRIQLDIGGVTKYADYLSGTSTSALTFRYTVLASDEDLGGIGFFSSVIDLNGGTLLDTAGNPINLNLDATLALPNLSSVIVDGVIPTVAITSSPDITSANELTYSVSGTCSEDGRTVLVDIDTIGVSPTCSGGTWTTGSIDVSARPDNVAFPITADHTDQAGNNATQASVTADKNTVTPTVTITFALDITSANDSNYSVSGSCTENGVMVDVYVGAINVQPNCSGGTWTTGTMDVSALVDSPSISVTADHSSATQATTTIAKDTASPIVVISSSPNINLTNETSYIASGTCSENAVMVDVNIGVLNFTPTCSSGSWTTGSIDVSALVDSGSITFTADHSTAPQATTTVSKNTSSPTVASLSVPTTLANSADPSWTLNDPGGFTVNDFDINYRVKGSPTWLSFADGVSLDTSTSVTGLLASTTYEFRVRVQYDTINYSDWSNTAEGETKPDTPLFSSPYAAMNVAGATTTNVVAYYDSTVVTLNGVAIAGSPLSKGQVVNITTAQFDIIDADKPIYTAGRRGSGGNTAKANIVWQPASWAGKNFSFNSIRDNPQKLHVFATENSNIQVKQGTTVLASTTLTAGNGSILSWSVYGSYQVISTGTILAFHSSGDPATRIVDPKPLLPSSLEMIGFPSNSMRITTDVDSTNYSLIHSESTTASGSLNKADAISINNLGGASQYAGDSLLISGDQKIAGASFADSNGNCAAPFLPTSLMRKNYAINISSDWVAFASKQAGTIDVVDSAGTVIETLTLTRTGGNSNAPFKVRRATTPAGYRFFATVPVAAWYQPNNDTGGADQDETILYGTNE